MDASRTSSLLKYLRTFSKHMLPMQPEKNNRKKNQAHDLQVASTRSTL